MKTIKSNSLGIFIFFSILFGSCFSSPEFSVVPWIEYQNIIFKPSTTLTSADSLIVFLDFKDGDGDLGLGPTQTDDPYHPVNYYLEHNGDTIPLSTSLRYTDLPSFINVPSGAEGKLVTVRTRENPLYQSFPEYTCPYSRTAYQYDSVFISEDDKDIFDTTYNLVKTMTSSSNPNVYVLLDTFYIKPNKNHYNIDVEFWIKNGPSSPTPYTLFDWKTEQCIPQDFSQRFPILTDAENPLEGTLKYAMTSVGFKPNFDGKTMKLRLRIRDRALHESKWVDTIDFILADITE